MTFEGKKDRDFSAHADVAIKSFRSDARHDMRNIVQRERLANDVRIGREMVLPVAVTQNHGRLRGCAEARSAEERHADRLEIVRGDKHRPRGVFLYFALPVRPGHKRGSGIGVAQIDVVRIRPDIGRLCAAHWRREDFDQSVGFQAGRLDREYSREIRNNGDDGRHARFPATPHTRT